jgi:hypothetical protein
VDLLGSQGSRVVIRLLPKNDVPGRSNLCLQSLEEQSAHHSATMHSLSCHLRELALDVDEEARNALPVDDGPLLAERLRVDQLALVRRQECLCRVVRERVMTQ